MHPTELITQLREKSFVPDAEYDIVRAYSARSAHDVIIYLPAEEKILLAKRKQHPSAGEVWPFGGGQKIGYAFKDSLRYIVQQEAGIELTEIECISPSVDHFSSTGPKGEPVHDIGVLFTAIGTGDIHPNDLHDYVLIGPSDYTDAFRRNLKHWVRAGMDRAVERFFGQIVDKPEPFPDYYVDMEPVFEEVPRH